MRLVSQSRGRTLVRAVAKRCFQHRNHAFRRRPPLTGPALSVRLSAGYGRQTVLDDLAFAVDPGERLGLLGSSGTGKSTLLLAMLGLLGQRGGWARGEVLVGGENILALPRRKARQLRGRTFALVPQSPLTAMNPALTLERHFREAWSAHKPPNKARLQHRLAYLLERVHLPHDEAFLRRKPGEISVGQAQRCVLALALLHEPSVLIADEPTSSLDPVTQAGVLELFREITAVDGTALLFVSHDLLSVLRLCDGVAALADGRIVERLPVRTIAQAQSPSLQRLLKALPLPAEVLVQHLPSGNGLGTEVPQKELLPTQRL